MRKLFLICALISAFAFTAKSENIKSTTRSSNNNTKDVPVSADVISDTIKLDEVTVTSLYRNNVNVGYLIDNKTLISENYGQEPSHLFAKMPNVFSMDDNGTEFGYGYFRIRGLDQTRINVTMDGMPWNESEDYGTYFANSPDLMSSMHSIKVERGSSATNNGTASSGGSINLESVNLLTDTTSYAYIGAGSYNTYKTSLIYNSGLLGSHHAFHVKATQQQTDGFRDNSFNNSQAFTLKYGYWFNDRHSIDILSLNGRHRNCQGWLGNTLDELAANKHANGNVADDIDEWFQSVNKIQYKGKFNDNIFLTASAYLQYQNGWYNMDLDNYMIRMVTDPNGDGTPWDPTGIVYSYGLQHYLYGANAAAKFYFNDLNFTVGTNVYKYQREHFMNDRVSEHFKNVGSDEYYDNTGYKNDANVFAAVNYTLGKFDFNANVQYRHVDFRYTDHMNDAMSFSKNDFGTNWDFVNYGLGISYNIDNHNKLYVRYAEVSREPTRTDMFGGNEFFVGDLTTNKAERSNDVELGYEVSTDKIKANINLYYMNFRNERVLNGQYGLNGLPLHDTADKSYRYGAEATVDWNFWSNFHYVLNTSLGRNRIKTATYGETTHILTPAFTFNNEICYQASNWRVGINNQYHTKMYMDIENKYTIPEYLLFNVEGTYRWKKIEAGLRVNNIFNRTNYYNAAIGKDDTVLWFRNCGTSVFADLKFYF